MKYLLEKELRFALSKLPPCDEDRPRVYDIPLYKTMPIRGFDMNVDPDVSEPMTPSIRFRRAEYREAGTRYTQWVWVLEEIPERD